MHARTIGGAAVVVAVALGAFALMTVARRDRSTAPDLGFEQDVPSDVRAETDATWERFRDHFHGRSGCIGDVTVVLVRDVDGGDARYVAAEARIEIQIPTTPERYRESLTHELAHHVEQSCREFVSLQARLEALLAADGRPWRTGPTWAATPSERYAEAVVELVNGSRVRHRDTVPVDAAVVDEISTWAAGGRQVAVRNG